MSNKFNVQATKLRLQTISIIQFPIHKASNGDIIVMENEDVPFSIARVFVVQGSKGAIRGQHAHKECSQVLVCSNGHIDVVCDDGKKTKNYSLNSPNIGLFIPPGIWSQQSYKESSAATVLCDQKYNEAEYIRIYDEFVDYVRQQYK